MAQINQIGPGRKTTGTIDGVTYVTRNGVTYVRSTPNMPASAYNTPAAKKRQAIFKFVQMHLKLHLRTIKQTFTAKGNGTPVNRYYSVNGKALTLALDSLAEQYLDGQNITIDDVEQAISDYATANPKSITIASKSGYADVYLTGPWPETITLNALTGDSTVIIIVSDNGMTTTYNPDGSTVVVQSSNSSSSGSNGSSDGNENQNNTSNENQNENQNTVTVAAPQFSGETQFTETTQVSMSAESGAEIRYTLDGSTPTSSSTLYSAPVTLSDTTTVKAIAIKGGVSSSVTSRTYTKTSGGDNGGGGTEN